MVINDYAVWGEGEKMAVCVAGSRELPGENGQLCIGGQANICSTFAFDFFGVKFHSLSVQVPFDNI